MKANDTPVVEWDISKDETVLPDAQLLRSLSATNYHVKVFQRADIEEKWLHAPHPLWRQRALMKATLVMGKNFSGVGAEIGAGTGMYTSILSRIPAVERIYCIDYSRDDVEQLMPVVFNRVDADLTKIVRVVGSFNAMDMESDSLDFIIAIGALHHSENLGLTARECYRVLKPGGWLIASERAGFNTTHNHEIKKALDSEFSHEEKGRFGYDINSKITRAMNSEHEPRLCEYEADFTRAGFRVYAFTFYSPIVKSIFLPIKFLQFLLSYWFGDFLFRKRMCAIGYIKIPYYPWFAKGGFQRKPEIDPLLLICHKE